MGIYNNFTQGDDLDKAHIAGDVTETVVSAFAPYAFKGVGGG
jgi:hypothetical protein